MREILFRGKRTNNSEWVYGLIVKTDKDNVFVVNTAAELGCGICIEETDAIKNYQVIPETVGQFTGLTDKNGTKIFEGDIVEGIFLHMMAVGAVAAFRDGSFGLAWKRGNVAEFSPFTSMCNVEYEVIGNIHDNPELLEGA